MKSFARAFLVGILLCSHGPSQESQEPPQQDTDAQNGAKHPDINYVATPQHIVGLMLGLADVKQTDMLYDLGCGDGRIVVTAAQKYGCKALGVDIDPARVRESQANVKAANVEDLVTIEQRDIFELDLSKADVVTMYLFPDINVKLIPQLATMKPGSRIVSHDFDIAGIEPDVVVTCSRRQQKPIEIYMYELPLKKVAVTEPDPTLPDVQSGQAAEASTSKYVLKYVLWIVIASALGLAVILRLLRKHLGVIRLNVTITRP